ncbi:spore germination protein [Clostridium sp. A1-XYC3]|uniref:Spore germination protein n=1 Tax=Clostridium tanneri TaxID=3037988 RepID=A0ABU4JRS5_9CLOT|nr:spore germination protein [Clostridium sp. A1-XYC3]MDW8800844.1 spore germination protein [Clostridium sp. A1-XYC3]
MESANNVVGERAKNDPIGSDLEDNLNKLKAIFVYPENKDFIIRDIHIKAINIDGKILYLHGTVNGDIIEKHIIMPLLEKSEPNESNENICAFLMKSIITGRNVKKVSSFKEISNEIINGNTILLIKGHNEAISVSTTKYEHRSVEKPTTENALKGPKESFTESCSVNRSLIRKHLKDSKLISESIILDTTVFNEIFIMYIKDIANPQLLEEVRARLSKISMENVKNLSILEQYIEDKTYSLVPTVLLTERPDRVVAFLEEGYVAMLMEGAPYSLIVPVTIWSFFHTSEDQYQRWAYGNFTRLLRMIACYIALLTPGLYIAVSSYHIDMIPTDLVLAIAASREKLPFPAIIEVLLMELAFDLIREAGVRVPTPIGPTIGIVGALILGQAAVQANIVSPILVIVVSLTGLSSFAIPETSLNFMIRIGRFIFLFAGAAMGFYGMAVCFAVLITYLSTIKSFGVPFNSPIAPYYKSSKDTITRPPAWKQLLRPSFLRPMDKVRSKKPKGE